MPVSPQYRASASHAALGPDFYDVVAAAEFPDHILRYRNRRAAKSVGLDTLTDEEWVAHFGRFQPLADTFTEPLALRYHGHQFRVYNHELGDGRGFLFAQLYDDKGRLLDLATKGSGKTPWSRTADGRLGLSTSKSFVGLAPTGWKIVGENDATAANAIDADAQTLWRTRAAHPALTIDMGRAHRIGGFAYQPRQDWVFEGVVDRYRLETSADGTRWTTQIASGVFDNIRNNPMLQEVRFAPIEARYFRFTPLRDTDNTGWFGAAEITVLPAGSAVSP